MTREILFRGKRIIDGEWVESNIAFVDNTPKGARGFVVAGYDYNSDDVPKVLYPMEIKPETIGQFTGLKDKNGKKVFEGDVLSFADSYAPHFAVVVFETEDIASCGCCYESFHGSGFVGKVLPGSKYHASSFCEDFAEAEIIGNIHDNPSLIKNEDAA